MYRLRRFMQQFFRNRLASGALVLTSLMFLIGFIGLIAYPVSPLSVAGRPLEMPGPAHPMGTDDLGRDILAQFLNGSRTSFLVGFSVVAVALVVGIMVGAISGYFGGKIDAILMRMTEIFLVLPTFIFAVVLVSVFGSSIWNVIFIIGIISWPTTARLLRAEFLSLKESEFVKAATAIGDSKKGIIFTEILPNAITPIVVNSSFEVSKAILAEAGLSFLGLGDPNTISWGQMLFNARLFMRIAWWLSIFPGLAIFLLILALNIVGDGLNEALNPHKTRRRKSLTQ